MKTLKGTSSLELSTVAGTKPVMHAITAAFVSEQGTPVYAKVADYLTKHLGQKVELITGFSYSTVNELLGKGEVDIGFVCGLPYVMSREHNPPQSQIIAAPVMKAKRYQNRPQYFSDLIERVGGIAKDFFDLRGKVFVYNEKSSNSGYNMPRYHMVKLGLTHGFFKKVVRSGSHEESIRMVAEGLADVSAVDSLVLDYDRAKNPEYASRVREIESLGLAPIPPVVVSTSMAAPLRDLAKKSLIEMDLDSEGRMILSEAMLERFVAVADQDYQPIRMMRDTALEAGFSELR